MENFDSAILLSNREGLPPDVIFDAYYNAGVMRIDIGQYDKAIEHLNMAMGLISADKSNPYYTACPINLGYTYVKRV